MKAAQPWDRAGVGYCGRAGLGRLRLLSTLSSSVESGQCGRTWRKAGREEGRVSKRKAWVLVRPGEVSEATRVSIRDVSSFPVLSLPSQVSTILLGLQVTTPAEGLVQDQQCLVVEFAKWDTQMPTKHPVPYVPLNLRVCSMPGTLVDIE